MHNHRMMSQLSTPFSMGASFSAPETTASGIPRSSNARFFASSSDADKKEGDDAKTTDEADATATDETKTEDEAATEEEAVDEKEIELKQLKEKVSELEQRLLRSYAEQENIRSIAKRDVQSARDFSIKKFAKTLLDVSDNLSRALDAVPEELRKDTEHHAVLAALYEGIEMTENGLLKSFGQNGLTKFCEEPGDVFDPTKHEALFEYPDPEKEPGTVGQVMKVGFMLNSRVLRPAEVGIIKKA